MRRLLTILGLLSLCSGCSLGKTIAHNVLSLPRQRLEECFEDHRNQRLAHEAWSEFIKVAPRNQFTDDYAAGFEAGFCDFLKNGEPGEPPALAPKKYWRVRYQSPYGMAAVQQWFGGFRHGAAQARESGYRQFVTMPMAGHMNAPPNPMPTIEAVRSANPPQQPQTATIKDTAGPGIASRILPEKNAEQSPDLHGARPPQPLLPQNPNQQVRQETPAPQLLSQGPRSGFTTANDTQAATGSPLPPRDPGLFEESSSPPMLDMKIARPGDIKKTAGQGNLVAPPADPTKLISRTMTPPALPSEVPLTTNLPAPSLPPSKAPEPKVVAAPTPHSGLDTEFLPPWVAPSAPPPALLGQARVNPPPESPPAKENTRITTGAAPAVATQGPPGSALATTPLPVTPVPSVPIRAGLGDPRNAPTTAPATPPTNDHYRW